VIISSSLNEEQEEKLLRVLRDHKIAIGWTTADIKGINPSLCMHKILIEENYKPSIEPPIPLKFKELLPHLQYNKEYWEVTFDMKIAGAKRLCQACPLEWFHLIAKEKKARLLKEPKLFAEVEFEYFKTSATSSNLI